MGKVVIVGGQNVNTLSIVEALGQKGLRPDVIVCDWRKDNYILQSKFVDRGWTCRTDEAVIECILDNYKGSPVRPVCIAEGDIVARLLNENYDLLKNVVILPGIDRQGELSEWMDKQKMTLVAQSVGLSIPDTWLVNVGEDAPLDVDFPCVTKGITSVSSGKVESKMFTDRQSLNAFLHEKHLCDMIQIQRFIEKEFEFQYIGVSLNHGEEIYIPGRTNIKDVCDFDNLTFLKFEKTTGNVITLEKTKEFIRNTGYSGLFSVEYIHGKDGKDYFLEINFRNDGNCNAVTSAGANLPYIWYLYNMGGDYKKEIADTRIKEIYFCPDVLYLNLAISGKIKYRQWLAAMIKANSYALYYPDDKKPFYSWLRANRKRLLKEIFKRDTSKK